MANIVLRELGSDHFCLKAVGTMFSRDANIIGSKLHQVLYDSRFEYLRKVDLDIVDVDGRDFKKERIIGMYDYFSKVRTKERYIQFKLIINPFQNEILADMIKAETIYAIEINGQEESTPLDRNLFTIPFDKFSKLSKENAKQLKRKIWQENKDYILNEINKRNAEWILIIGNEIKSSKTKEDLPTNEDLKKEAMDKNLTPFLYIKPPIIDECCWNDTSSNSSAKKDYYPTIPLTLIDKNEIIIGDFDTGAEQTHVSDRIILINELDFFSLQNGFFHEDYEFTLQHLNIALNPEFGPRVAGKIPIAIVSDWEKSGFKKSNKERSLLVGRDVLNNFPIRVELDSRQKKTRIFAEECLINISLLENIIDVIETIDPYRKGHSDHVCKCAELISRQLSLCEEAIESIKMASRFHDLGYILINTNVLNKKEFTSEDYEIIKSHPYLGLAIIGYLNIFNNEVLSIINHHHEKFDGSGYPDGLEKNKIPLGSRIIAVADSYIAMTSSRPYRGPLLIDDALESLQNNKKYDPEIVQAFLTIYKGG